LARVIRKHADYLLEKGFVRCSTPPFAAPILFTPKKHGGLRMCIDYRALNRVTIKSRYPIPRADGLIDQLRGAKFFSKIDLRCGYHQISMNEADCYKTAFQTRYGSHVISIDGVKIDPKKIATIQDWKPLANLRELKSFLGFVNYVHRFIPNMAGVTSPLTDLLKKDTFYCMSGGESSRLRSNSLNFSWLHLRFFGLQILTARSSSLPTLTIWLLVQYCYKTSANTKIWQQYGTRLHLSTAYHPQSDGQTERTNQTMEQLIRTTCTDPAQWEDSLPLIEFAYNNALSATTTQSPFFLNYMIDPTTPLSQS
ncbi:hypothetical protein CLOP_g1793, partial [Closterium sp. NIES-67]